MLPFMYKFTFVLFLLTSASLVSLSFKDKVIFSLVKDEVDVNDLPVELVLNNLGSPKYKHSISKLDPEKAEIGKQLILNGKSKYIKQKGKKISIYFKCTDCHNLVKEVENPADLSADSRLLYAQKNNLPFLPASTLWGVYNRTSFYNGDYVKKYGKKIKTAKDSLQNAVQVCAKYNSSGRFLEAWELEGIMHYFKQNELKIKDLNLSTSAKKNILYWQKLDETEKRELIKTIESSFSTAYPATFLATKSLDERKYGEGGNAANGEFIFKQSCLYCHAGKRVSNFNLEANSLTGRFFWKNIETFKDFSLYQIVRWGTYTKTRRRQFMPLYTKEKMSDEQLEDLVAYIKVISKK